MFSHLFIMHILLLQFLLLQCNDGVLFCFRLMDIEYEMTNFAYYYVGIGAGVFILGYLQVSLWFSLVFVNVQNFAQPFYRWFKVRSY